MSGERFGWAVIVAAIALTACGGEAPDASAPPVPDDAEIEQAEVSVDTDEAADPAAEVEASAEPEAPTAESVVAALPAPDDEGEQAGRTSGDEGSASDQQTEAPTGGEEEPDTDVARSTTTTAQTTTTTSTTTTTTADVTTTEPASAPEPEPDPGSDGRLAGFQWPAEGRISAEFGYRVHPVYGTRKLYPGISIDGEEGDPVRAAQAGTVIQSGEQGGYGLTVVVDHGDGVTSLYAHQQELLVEAGAEVGAGDQLGTVGFTGATTGSVLFFKIDVDGEPVDPVEVLPPRS